MPCVSRNVSAAPHSDAPRTKLHVPPGAAHFVRRDAFFYQRRRRVRARAAQRFQRREEVGDERPVDERALVMVRTVYVRGAVPERVKSVVRIQSDAVWRF